MSTHLSRLRRQCQPVQEDTPVAPAAHRISVDKRDLLQLLADYDAAQKAACFFAANHHETNNVDD